MFKMLLIVCLFVVAVVVVVVVAAVVVVVVVVYLETPSPFEFVCFFSNERHLFKKRRLT